MIDFKIRRGLSTTMFSEPGVVNPRLIIEEGCWYLCTDTAELFLGVKAQETLHLKRFNEHNSTNIQPGNGISIDNIEINTAGELVIYYTDGTSANLGRVVGVDGKDGAAISIKIGDVVYSQTDGIIELPNFATKTFVEQAILEAEFGDKEIDLNNYVTKDDIKGFITEVPSEYITESELDAKGYLQVNKTFILHGGSAN